MMTSQVAVSVKDNLGEMLNLVGKATLSRRLDNLLNMDQRTAISKSYITAIEYQLFLDETQPAGQIHQPDHWSDTSFPRSWATMPVAGVRLSDAEVFCHWLTVRAKQSTQSQHHLYRLPRPLEAKQYPATQRGLGSWCIEGEQVQIVGVEQDHWRAWQQQLADTLARDLDADFARDYDLPLHLGDKDRARDSALERVRNRDKSTPHIQRLYRRIATITLNRLYDVDLENVRISAQFVADALHQHRKIDSSIDMFVRLARDLDDALGRADSFGLLRSYLLCVHILWDILREMIEAKQRNRVLARQKVDVLIREYQCKVEESFYLYARVVLVDERRHGRMPVWEGIRIVREHM